MKMHSGYVTLVVVHAPTNENQSKSKKFYCDLQDVTCISRVPNRDLLLVAGDFNTLVGKGNETWRRILRQHSPDMRNENGECLLTSVHALAWWLPTLFLNIDLVTR